MQQYFFDVNAGPSVRYDYSGRQLASVQHARELAELIALDIACTTGDEARGFQVEVRDIAGKRLFSIPVGSEELLAA